MGAVKKSAAAAGDPMAGPWAAVLEKLNLSGTHTGLKASGAAEQLTAQMAQMAQMQSAMRETRAASLRAAQPGDPPLWVMRCNPDGGSPRRCRRLTLEATLPAGPP